MKKKTTHPYPWYSPRFWHGMRMGDWFQLLARNRFRISPTRLGLAFTVSCMTVVNSGLSLIQWLIFRRRIANTVIEHPPIFIIGHWRSGTTYLHELMVRDEQYTFPTTYDCFMPNHFLISGWFLPRLVGFLLPGKRPMDNMDVGFDSPQEDEWALASARMFHEFYGLRCILTVREYERKPGREPD